MIATTADGQGGYHVSETMDEKAAGASLTTGTKYTASKTDTWDWYAGAPFPAVNTHTTDSELVSKAGTANFLLTSPCTPRSTPTVSRPSPWTMYGRQAAKQGPFRGWSVYHTTDLGAATYGGMAGALLVAERRLCGPPRPPDSGPQRHSWP